MDIAEHIGDKYESFSICLLNDTEGVQLTSIKYSSTTDISSILNKAFIRWLAGSGRTPITWTTFVKCLRDVKLNRLAEIIEEEYTYKNYVPESAKAGESYHVKPNAKEAPEASTETVKERDQSSVLNTESDKDNTGLSVDAKLLNTSSTETVKIRDSSSLESSNDPVITEESTSPSTAQLPRTSTSDEDQGK